MESAYGRRGAYIDMDGRVRCSCDMKLKHEWDKTQWERHLKYKVHQAYEKKKEEEGVHQARMTAGKEKAAREEAERLKLAGTRSTEAECADQPFRESFVSMCLQLGIPLNTADKMRPWVQTNCNRSLTDRSHLAACIPKLFEDECKLQEEVLKTAKHVGIIFDATPRKGDLFALLARRIELNEEIKRATAPQELIHCAALKGSLNAVTLSSEVNKGLMNRRLTQEQAVVSMSDGCFTNGASLNHWI